MKAILERLIVETLGEMGLPAPDFVVEHPADLSHGDYSANVAMVLAKKLGKNPRELAEEIAKHLETKKNSEIEKTEVAGAGFINFHLTKKFFNKSIGEIIEKGEEYGKNDSLKGEKTMVEYTDPNPFKEFHIGHLMSNSIGETLSRIIEWNGAEVKRACYQGDVGLHVAKAIWGALKNQESGIPPRLAQTRRREAGKNQDWGKYYSHGAKTYEGDEDAKKEIQEINKKIYERSDEKINELYDAGKKASLEHFDTIYKKLGTDFDYFFFESETGERGKKLVSSEVGKVFEESDGAIVFHAEKFDPKLHTRVFLNSEGLPTYEAKELGLAPIKYEKYQYDRSIVITGNEVSEYFKVVLEAMKQVFPELAEKTEHLSHGMLRWPTGKMSSRTGDVTTIEELRKEVKKRTEDNEDAAIGAIKYMILRQSIGNDIIFDIEKSVSTEGDSGVYLQYTYARTNSLLEKAGNFTAQLSHLEVEPLSGDEVRVVERLVYRFPEVVERARKEYAPNLITTYLTELASSYNNFYAHEQIIPPPDWRARSDDPYPYRLAITKAFNIVMKNGLNILAIPAPERI